MAIIKKILLRLPEELKKQLETEKEEQGRGSLNNMILWILQRYFKEKV